MKINLFVLLFVLFSIGQSHAEIQPVKFENTIWTPQAFDQSGVSNWMKGSSFNQEQFLLVQFDILPSGEVKNQLKGIGVRFLEYYPDNTYLLAVNPAVTAQELIQSGANGYGKLPIATKMTRDLYRGDIGDWAIQGPSLSVVIKYFEGLPIEDVKSELGRLGVKVESVYEDYTLIHGTVDINTVYDLPKSELIQFVSAEAEPGQPEDVEGRSLHRSNRINTSNPLGPKYDGTGVTVQARDDGMLGPHIDFHGRLKGNAIGIFGTIEHMDGVAGIFAGAGNVDPDNSGMATGADLYATNYVDHFLDNTLDLHQQEGVLVTNSSYSNGCNDGYTVITQTVDRQIHQNPTLLHVFSAGNSGTRDCQYGAGNRWGNITGGHKQGKNVIATANLRVDVSLENSSSRGPSTDGRIKPDISARGTNQVSTDPNHAYSEFGGTSAAAPGVAGVCAQLIHAYKDLNNQELPPSSLIKSSLLNTANDLGNVGPDFLYGWGHLNAYRAFKLLEEKRYENGTIGQSEEKTHTFDIPSGVQEVRFMLYWRDKEASLGAGKALVNDLDLSVEFKGDEYYPYVLDHTPVPTLLDKPAEEGIDRLNNVEQVRFFNPEAGEYTLNVAAFAIPFSDIDYHVLMEVIEEEIDLVYPISQESFIPGETEQIHWDASIGTEPFRIEYSNDGGVSWTFIGQATASSRTFSWMVPGIATSNAKVRVSRGAASDETDDRFYIYPQPSTVRLLRVCPDYIEIEWDGISQAATYDVYLLGEKYMEVVMEVDTNYAQVMVEDVLAEHWFAVQAKMDDGGLAQRTNAVPYRDGVRNCMINADISLDEIVNPNPYLVYSCGEYDESVELIVTNNGAAEVTSITAEYELTGGIMGSENFMVNLAPAESTTLVFTDKLTISTPGQKELKVTISTTMDDLPGNDELTQVFTTNNIANTAAAVPFSEDFDSGAFPPNGWEIISEVPLAQWERDNIVGVTGSRTNVIALNVVSSAEIAYVDEFYLQPIDLTNESRAALSFDYACNVETDDFIANLSIVVYSFCDDRVVKEIFNVGMDFMETVDMQMGSPWEPETRNDWQKIALDLSQFVGSQVVIGFIAENGADYDLFIDNINITNADLNLPDPDFSISDTTPCSIFSPVIFEASFVSNDYDYQWNFGDRANPRSASGPGPHNVRFFNAGVNEIALFIRDKSTGAYVIEKKNIEVFVRPSPRFTSTVNNLDVQFTNNSANADSYEWDFGDGKMSIEENPLHTYEKAGTYKVVLKAIGTCTIRETDQNVMVETVSADDVLKSQFNIYPNPASDFIIIEKLNEQLQGDYSLMDVNGKTFVRGVIGAESSHLVDIQSIPNGSYLLKAVIGDKTISYRIVKMK